MPVHSIGKYGGTWRRVSLGSTDLQLSSRMGYEPPIRWERDGRTPGPGLAKSWEVLDGGSTFVLHLRKGLKWSDGHPFTSEDFDFFFNDCLLNKEINPVYPQWLVAAGEPVEVSAPDAETVVFRFAEPYGVFVAMLCFRGNWTYLPKHYMKQFHPSYRPQEEIERDARKRGYQAWQQLFQDKSSYDLNPELPTCRPYQLKVGAPAARMLAVRNPYYWKVDPEGNQLPYIDEIAFTNIQTPEHATFKALAGEVDMQERRIDSANFTLFMENRKRGRYRVLHDPSSTPDVLYVNQHSKDESLRPLLQDRRFRIALSVAINREELIDLLYSGLAAPTRGVASPYDPNYLPEFEADYMDYNPELANRLLDELGMTRGGNGLRRMPDGRPFRQLLQFYPSETGTGTYQWQLVADYFREVGLDFIVKTDNPNLSVLQMRNGNSDFWGYACVGLHWVLDPLWYMPYGDTSYFAPLYGKYVATNGRAGVKPPPQYQKLYDWYLELKATPDTERQIEVGRRILREWSEQCYTIGICRPELLAIVSNRFKNVPDHIIHGWTVMTPGYIGIEQFYIDEDST